MAIRSLLPNLDQRLVSVTGNGGTTPISPKLVDGADGTYAAGTANGGYAWVRVGPGTMTVLAANERCRWVRVHARAQHEGTDIGHLEHVTLVPRNPDSVPKVNPDRWLFGSGAGFVEKDSQKWTTTPDAKEWTNRTFDNLQVEAIWKASVNNKFVRLVELRMDYDVCTQPSVTGVSVTNTATSRPTVTATYTSVDGFGQKRYQLRVFGPAAYTTPGFSPDTASPTWDSGQVYDDQIGPVTVGVDLVGGVTYRAYARASYDFNGGDYWSAWAFGTFAVATEPPAPPTLTAALDSELQRVVLTTQGRMNMLTADQADFEGGTTGWAAGAGTTIAQSNTFARHGTFSLRLTNSSGGAATVSATTTTGVGGWKAAAGVQYTAVAYVRAGATGRSCRLRVVWSNAAGSPIGNPSDGLLTPDTTGVWTLLSVTATAPAGTATGALVLEVQGAANGEQHYTDQAQVAPGISTAWTPGGYLPTATTRVDYWDVADGNVNQARPELAAGDTSRTTTPGYAASAGDTLQPDPLNALAGGSGVQWIPSTTSSRLDIGYPRGLFAADYALPAPPGTVCVASVWAKASAVGNYTLAAEVCNGVGGTVALVPAAETVALSPVWQRVWVAFEIPAGAIHGQLGLTNQSGATGQSVWVDQFQWEVNAPDTGEIAGVAHDPLHVRVLDELDTGIAWLDGAPGVVSEVGWPGTVNAAEWNMLANDWYARADAAGLWVTAWAAGEWWDAVDPGKYNLLVYGDTGAPTGLDTAFPPATTVEAHPTVGARWRGVNAAGGEWNTGGSFSNTNPGVYDVDYHYDSLASFQYLYGRGIRVVRLPFRWERLQRTLGGAFDAGEQTRLVDAVNRAGTAGLKVILDPHNDGGYKLAAGERKVGTAEVTRAHFTDFHKRLTALFKANANVLAYGLMGAPNGIGGSYTAAATRETWDVSIGTWTGDPGVTVTRTTTTVHDGAGALEASKSFTAGGFQTFRFGNNDTTTHDESGAGRTYGFWAKAPAGESGWEARLDIQDAALATIAGQVTALDPNTWTFCTSTFTAAQLASMKAKTVQVQHANPTAGTKTCQVDTITQGSAVSGPKMWEGHTQAAVDAIRAEESTGGDYNRLFGLFIDTNEAPDLTSGAVPANRFAYVVVHWNVAGSQLAAIRAMHPAAKILAYQNLGGMIAGPHTNNRPTTAVTQEDANAHAGTESQPTLNYNVAGGPSASGCTNSTVTVQATGMLQDMGGAAATTPAGTSPASPPGTITYWNDVAGQFDMARWALRIDRDPGATAGYYWANQGIVRSSAGGSGNTWYAGLQHNGVVPDPAFTGKVVNYAIWNAEDSQPGDLPGTWDGAFSGEGSGYRVAAPFPWVLGRTYTMWVVADPALGARWFTLYIRDETTGDETRVGSIRATTSDSSKLNGVSYQWTELFSQSPPATTCGTTPRSTVFFTRPSFATGGGTSDSWYLHRESDGSIVTFDDFAYIRASHVGRASWREKAKAHLAQIDADGFDGVFWDDTNMYPGHGFNEGDPGDSVEFTSNNAYRDATVDAMAVLTPACRALGLLSVPNIGMNPWVTDHYTGYQDLLSRDLIDGAFREFYVNWRDDPALFSGATWTDTMRVQLDAEAAGKFAVLNAYPLTTPDHVRHVRYGLASFYANWDPTKAPGSAFGYEDGRYAYADYRQLIGTPTETKQLVSGTATDGAWIRHYTGGVVCVNAKSTAGLVTFNLGGSYLDPGNVSVSSVQLDQQRGMVLLSGTGGAGTPKTILVPLEGRSGTQAAQTSHPDGPWITDPLNLSRYELRHYWDRDNSGDYPNTYPEEVADAESRGYAAVPGRVVTPADWSVGRGTPPTWEPVRGYAAVTPPAATQAWSESDFEVPTGRARIYRARSNVAVAGSNLASGDAATSFAEFWIPPDGAWRLVDIHRPEHTVALFVTGDSLPESLTPDQVELHPAGADHPVVYADFMGGYRGTIPVLSVGEQDWAALEWFVTHDDVWYLKLPEGGGRYVRFQDRTLDRAVGSYLAVQRRLTLPYVQVQRPADGA